MGGVCCKPWAIEDDSRKSPAARVSAKLRPVRNAVVGYERRSGGLSSSLRREGAAAARVAAVRSVSAGKKRERQAYEQHLQKVARTVPRAVEGEQVAAGWPSWLASVAGEAIRGWVPRRGDSFEKLNKIGQGTYSNVYRARDLENGKIVALKKVRFDNLEPESVRFMSREICILRKLDHPNIIKLEGLVTSRMSCSLYLVFEYMEHDLAGLTSCPGFKFTESQVKCYMQQLLRGLNHCHSRYILHRDIKGSNLLIDNSGILKIADFGLASFFDPDSKQPLTSRVITLWYRPPELLLGATDYGVAVDLWSTGCILAELYAGKPIMPGRTEVEQLHKIFKLCGSPSEDYWKNSKLPQSTIFKPQQPYIRCVNEMFKDFPAPALALMGVLLSVDPADRGTTSSALKSEFFTTKPFACDPSSLPKYPPSKEFDAKVRNEETRRQGGAGGRLQKFDNERKATRESRVVAAPDANAELAISLQKRQSQSSSKSRSEIFNVNHEDVASGFPIDPPRPSQALAGACQEPQIHISDRASYSGPLFHRGAWAKVRKTEGDASKVLKGAELSVVSTLAVAQRNSSDDQKDKIEFSRLNSNNVAFEGKYVHIGNQQEDKQAISQDPQLLGYGSKGKKIHYSGPLIRASASFDKMLKEHDRQVQEAVRRARLDKAKIKKIQVESEHSTAEQYTSRPTIAMFET